MAMYSQFFSALQICERLEEVLGVSQYFSNCQSCLRRFKHIHRTFCSDGLRHVETTNEKRLFSKQIAVSACKTLDSILQCTPLNILIIMATHEHPHAIYIDLFVSWPMGYQVFDLYRIRGPPPGPVLSGGRVSRFSGRHRCGVGPWQGGG